MKPPKTLKPQPTIRFKTVLLRLKIDKKTGAKSSLVLPKNVSTKLSLQTKITVEGIINSFPFRTTLELDSKGSYYFRVSKAMHDAVRVDKDTMVTVEITRIGKEVETRVPLDLHKALIAIPRAQALWSEITPIARRDWIYWIISAKKPETRQRRIDIACDKLVCGKGRVCCFGGIGWLKKQGKI